MRGSAIGFRGRRTRRHHHHHKPGSIVLGALAHWQRHPGDLSDHAFELLVSPTAGRVAAPLAREFARRLAQAGLVLRHELPAIETKPFWHTTAGQSLMH